MFQGIVIFKPEWNEEQCSDFIRFIACQYGVETATLTKKEEETANANES